MASVWVVTIIRVRHMEEEEDMTDCEGILFEKQIKAMDWAGVVEVICKATTCLFSCSKVHAAYVCKLEENLKSLQEKCDHLQNISSDVQTKINEAEATGEMQRTSEVKDWVQQVQNLQKELDDIQNKGCKETQSKCLKGCCPKNCSSSYKLGKKVVKMQKQVDELVANGRRFTDKNVIIAQKLPSKPVEEMPLDEIIGLDLMLGQVWSCLEDENVGILGLYGMGGAGKTTLMKRILREFGKRMHDFEVVLWVVVSKDLDIDKIMNDIRNRLGIKDEIWNGLSSDRRAAKIHEVLQKKKYVLMLDDLWERLELNKVGVENPKNDKYESKIVFTTRSRDVCAKMQAQKKFEVECLSEEEAFDLFCKRVGEETLKCHGEIRNVARKIVKKCNGLPLAVVTVGYTMAGVTDIESWKQAESSLRNYPEIALGMEKDVFPILKFSYDRLPNETYKKCFLYCSLYPEDYEINVDDVIYRWIGEGFLGENKTKKSIHDMYAEGKSIIEKLKRACLLEDVVEDNLYSSLCIKMHDVIREMALWLGRDEDGSKDKVVLQEEALALTSEMNSERCNVVERISILNVRGRWQIPACPNLITLRVRGVLDITDYSNFQYMTKLKVLDLSYTTIGHLPFEIGKLINLEFLNLSNFLNMFQIELKNLKNLRVLLMEDFYSKLKVIPLEGIEIESLERLKVFRFSYSYDNNHKNVEGEEELLEKLESLTELEEVCMELRTLTGMRKLLQSTKLLSCSTHFFLQLIEGPLEMASILETLSTMMHLKYAPLLRFLRVECCGSIEEVVKEDGGSDSDDANNHIFSNLTRLILSSLPKLKSIHKKALSFPFLKFIRVLACPNLKKLPLNSNSAKDTLIRIIGEHDWWNNLEWEDPALRDQFHSKLH
ncbi:hypothetical protein VNO77_05066 [Canavalia gladiata]|uniref:Uncharacterized protein n=1 Tax=Canavalia gladiata TaxID=3824 RepID=A0AAN9MYC7_CANGL